MTLYAGQDVYVRNPPHLQELMEIALDKLVNNKLSNPKLLFKYYNETTKGIEYHYVELTQLNVKI